MQVYERLTFYAKNGAWGRAITEFTQLKAGLRIKVQYQAGAYPGFLIIKQLGVF